MRCRTEGQARRRWRSGRRCPNPSLLPRSPPPCRSCSSSGLENRSNALAAADALRGEGEGRPFSLEEACRLSRDAGAACTQGMAKGDGSAVDVDSCMVQSEFLQNGDALRSESLVDLGKTDVSCGKFGSFQSLFR